MEAADGAASDGDEAERKRLPATTGRIEPVKLPGFVRAGILMGGRTRAMPMARRMTTPILRKVTR